MPVKITTVALGAAYALLLLLTLGHFNAANSFKRGGVDLKSHAEDSFKRLAAVVAVYDGRVKELQVLVNRRRQRTEGNVAAAAAAGPSGTPDADQDGGGKPFNVAVEKEEDGKPESRMESHTSEAVGSVEVDAATTDSNVSSRSSSSSGKRRWEIKKPVHSGRAGGHKVLPDTSKETVPSEQSAASQDTAALSNDMTEKVNPEEEAEDIAERVSALRKARIIIEREISALCGSYVQCDFACKEYARKSVCHRTYLFKWAREYNQLLGSETAVEDGKEKTLAAIREGLLVNGTATVRNTGDINDTTKAAMHAVGSAEAESSAETEGHGEALGVLSDDVPASEGVPCSPVYIAKRCNCPNAPSSSEVWQPWVVEVVGYGELDIGPLAYGAWLIRLRAFGTFIGSWFVFRLVRVLTQ